MIHSKAFIIERNIKEKFFKLYLIRDGNYVKFNIHFENIDSNTKNFDTSDPFITLISKIELRELDKSTKVYFEKFPDDILNNIAFKSRFNSSSADFKDLFYSISNLVDHKLEEFEQEKTRINQFVVGIFSLLFLDFIFKLMHVY